jgi:hypothetical protein
LTQLKLVERLKPLSRPLLRLALCVAALAIGAIGWLCYCEYRNSREVPPPTEVELRQHLGRAVGWIFANISQVSTENNPMLWVFIRDAARLTGDTRLMASADEYQSRYVKGTVSQFFFDPNGSEQLAGRHIDFPDDWDVVGRLPGNRVLVWEGGRLYPWIRTQPASNLHATAQGLYLLALLVNAGQ